MQQVQPNWSIINCSISWAVALVEVEVNISLLNLWFDLLLIALVMKRLKKQQAAAVRTKFKEAFLWRPIAEAYKDFPILHKEHNGHRVIYLDSGATAQIPVRNWPCCGTYDTTCNGKTAHRGSHILAIEASEDIMKCTLMDRVVGLYQCSRTRRGYIYT